MARIAIRMKVEIGEGDGGVGDGAALSRRLPCLRRLGQHHAGLIPVAPVDECPAEGRLKAQAPRVLSR